MKMMSNSIVSGAIAGAAVSVSILLAVTFFGILGRSSDRQIHDFLLEHPQILVAVSQKLQQTQRQAEAEARQSAVRKLGAKAFFDPRFAFVAGPKNAQTTFVEFFDYNCPYCRASIPVVRKFYQEHRADTRFAFIEFPIKGRESITASRAAIAARKQPDKYVDFHFRLMGETNYISDDLVFADAKKAGLDVDKLKADMRDPAVDHAISEAHRLAEATNIDGTPAFVVNGHMREGFLNTQELSRLLKGA